MTPHRSIPKFIGLSVLTLLFFFSGRAQKPFDSSDIAGVRQAVLDYTDAFYELDTARLYRSVHPELVKRGFAARGSSPYSQKLEMRFHELVELAKVWNVDGKIGNKNSIRKVEIFDILDKTASAKLTATWGTDYFHLAKLDGKWMILNVLWQTPVQTK